MSTQEQPPVKDELLHLPETEPITVLHVDDERDLAELVAVRLEREHSSLEVLTETSAEG